MCVHALKLKWTGWQCSPSDLCIFLLISLQRLSSLIKKTKIQSLGQRISMWHISVKICCFNHLYQWKTGRLQQTNTGSADKSQAWHERAFTGQRTHVTGTLVKYAGEERMGKVNSRAINQPGTRGGQVGLPDSIRERCCSLSLGIRPWENRRKRERTECYKKVMKNTEEANGIVMHNVKNAVKDKVQNK